VLIVLIDGYDFTIIGIALEVGGGFLLAKGYLKQFAPMETAATYWGTNPFAIRSAIVAHHEAVAGFGWLFLGLLISAYATVRAVYSGQQGSIQSSLHIIAVAGTGGLALLFLTMWVIRLLSRRNYVPWIVANQREIFDRAFYAVAHDGETRDEVAAGTGLFPHIRAERLEHARERLNRVGKLLDLSRRRREDDLAFARRLSTKYFPDVQV